MRNPNGSRVLRGALPGKWLLFLAGFWACLADARAGNRGGGEERQCPEQLTEKTRQMVAKREEIVWAMDPQHDSLGAFVSCLIFFADRFLRLANIRLAIETSEEIASLTVEARVRHRLFLVFKEALANVVKHSRASEVRVAVRVENRILQVVLAGLLAAVFVPSVALAEPVTAARISELPTAEQAPWRVYLDRSQTNARLDSLTLQAEVAAHKMAAALRAPSGGDFKLPAKLGEAWFAQPEASQLADVVLSYQTPAGGWSKHTGYNKGPRRPGMQFTSQNEPGKAPHYVATFDNRSTIEEMYFLASVWHATKREDCKAGFIKGLNFILAAQYPNGGWPQVYPLEGDYHDDITFNDDAMTRILELLLAITRHAPYYAFLDDAQRQQAAAALDAGICCVLRTQVVQDGKRTVWCAQYDALTLQPASARKMEPATLSGLESAHILEFLMSITNPAPEIVASIESGLGWHERAKITGLAKTNVAGKIIYAANAASQEVYWARFYDLTNGQPVFPGRDGVIYHSFDEMAAQNRLGYDYLSTLPGSVVNNGQKKWRKMLAGPKKK